MLRDDASHVLLPGASFARVIIPLHLLPRVVIFCRDDEVQPPSGVLLHDELKLLDAFKQFRGAHYYCDSILLGDAIVIINVLLSILVLSRLQSS